MFPNFVNINEIFVLNDIFFTFFFLFVVNILLNDLNRLLYHDVSVFSVNSN
jgi:hypothetical protein